MTSLADSGPGTLREALSQSNRFVTFAVAGTIELLSSIRISGSYITVCSIIIKWSMFRSKIPFRIIIPKKIPTSCQIEIGKNLM